MILTKVPNSQLVLVFGASRKQQWRRTVEKRWAEKTRASESQTSKAMHGSWSTSERGLLYAVAGGRHYARPIPFGGGVTTLESLAVCTPVLTLPAQQRARPGCGYDPAMGARGDLAVTKALIASSTRLRQGGPPRWWCCWN